MGEPDSRASDSSRMRSARGRAIGKPLALALGCLISIALVEGGFRIWKWLDDDPYDGARAELRLDEFVQQLKGLNFIEKDSSATRPKHSVGMSLHPYEGYQSSQAWTVSDHPEAYYTSQESRETYDILLFGGSVAADFSNRTGSVLVPLLEADPKLAGRKVRIHNRACPGHKQPQHTMNLAWAISLGIRPDAVLLLDGFNDVAVAAENALYNVHPLFPSWWQMQSALSSPVSDPEKLEAAVNIFAVRRSAEQLADRGHRWGLMHSAVLGSIVERQFESLSHRSATLLDDLQQVEIRRKEGRPLLVRGPIFVNEPDNVLRMSGLAWMEGSRSMQASCRARNVHFVHVLQPAANDKGSKPLTEEEAQKAFEFEVWRDAIARGYPRVREAGAQLLREGVNFHDGSQVFADHPEKIYIDHCHFVEPGHTILGQFVARAILQSWPKDQ